VIGANMRRELFVALQLEDAHHFIEGSAGERTRRLESPPAFGATKTTETRIFDPYKLPAHRRCRCVTILSRTQRSPFAVLYSRLQRKIVTSPGVAEDVQRHGFYLCQSGWSVAHPTYKEDSCVCAGPDFRALFEQSNRLTGGFRFGAS